MIYIEYEKLRGKYYDALDVYDNILREKELLFKKAVNYNSYITLKQEQEIDKRLNEAKAIINERKELLKIKETELRNSFDLVDKIYALRFIDRLKIIQISMRINYSDRQINRYIKEIKKEMDILA